MIVAAVMVWSSAHTFSLSFWVLLTSQLGGFTVGKEAGRCKCGLILLSDPFSGFMVSQGM